MWVTVIFLFFVLPRLLLFLVDRRTSPKPETETTPAANAAPSIDDDWADIALQLKKENGND
nr:hypothetical protein [Brucella anthropi]